VHEGNARTESWDTQYLWMSRIELIDDAHISGGFFYFGSSDPSAPNKKPDGLYVSPGFMILVR